MTTQIDEEAIKAHKKSLLLLDETQEQLAHMREMLRKAVTRLSIAARSDNETLNNTLEQLKSAVRSEIDPERLNAHLDHLLASVNQIDDHEQESRGEFYTCLRDGLLEYEFTAQDQQYKNRIFKLVESKLPDNELSIKLLDLINEIISSMNSNRNDDEISKVRLFDNEIRGKLDLASRSNESEKVSLILDDLAYDIVNYIEIIRGSFSNGIHEHVCDDPNNTELAREVLRKLLNSLVLTKDIINQRDLIVRKLDCPIETVEEWNLLAEDIAALINQNIEALQTEKQELQVFIKKITNQLVEIEKYIQKSREESMETISKSSMLKDSVDSNVEIIQQTVGNAEDIKQLKYDVQLRLTEIRKSVEEYQHAETVREEVSKQGYSHIINELARTKKETAMLKEQLHESQKKMLRDPLTGLANRMAYEERIAVEINRCKRNSEPLCLAMWDIDHFKKINDTYGHDAGDRVLKFLSKIIHARIRKVDMFARIGGEEFALLMPDTNLENALNLNNHLRNSLENSGFHYNGTPCTITASVGIARVEAHDNAETAMRKADEALYQSKGAGRNRCTVFTLEGKM